MKIGIYGGTFDPIHLGHINLALEILEKCGLDEVWFCPAQMSPHKVNTLPAETEHRLKMLELSLDELPSFKILDIEINRPPPSYTIETLLLLREIPLYNQHEFFLILGDDAIPGFFQWREPEEIIKLAPLLIGSRLPEAPDVPLEGSPKVVEAIKRGLVRTRIMEVSGTDIRDRIQNGLYIGHLVPAKVVDYIYLNALYFNL